MTERADGRHAVAAALLAVGAIAIVTAASIGAMSLADALTATGLPNPGPVTTYGVPAIRAAGEIAAAVAVGGFLFAAFLVPPQASGVLDVGGYRALRLGGVACAIWAICAAMLVVLTVSDVSGIPLRQLGLGEIWAGADLVEITKAWRWTAILAALVAVASVPVLRWTPTPVLLAACCLTLVPVSMSGHSSSGGAHDMATNSMLIHLGAGALWVGGLLMLLAHALRSGTHLDLAARRFSAVALWCFAAIAVSGIINAAIRIRPGELLTDYGLLVVGKVLALCALGGLGWRQRRSGVAALHCDPIARGPLLRLALIEALIFGVTIGIAVGLGRTPPPPATAEPTPAQMVIGFDLAGPPTFARILLDWRFDLMFGTTAIALAVLYAAGVRRLRRRARPWPASRTVFWLTGCATLLVATSSGLGSYMPAMFSMHVVVWTLLSTAIPALLVAGAPVTLALRALPPAGRAAAPGPREWLTALLRSPLAVFLGNPAVASIAFIGGFTVLHTAPVLETAINDHTAHVVTNGYLLVTGCLFFSVVAGRANAPTHRGVLVICSLTAYFGVGLLLIRRDDVLGASFYRSIQLSWHVDLLADQRLGGEIIAGTALLAAVAVLVAALSRWWRDRAKPAPAPHRRS